MAEFRQRIQIPGSTCSYAYLRVKVHAWQMALKTLPPSTLYTAIPKSGDIDFVTLQSRTESEWQHTTVEKVSKNHLSSIIIIWVVMKLNHLQCKSSNILFELRLPWYGIRSIETTKTKNSNDFSTPFFILLRSSRWDEARANFTYRLSRGDTLEGHPDG